MYFMYSIWLILCYIGLSKYFLLNKSINAPLLSGIISGMIFAIFNIGAFWQISAFLAAYLYVAVAELIADIIFAIRH